MFTPVQISLLSCLTLTIRLLVVTCYNTCMIVITRDSANPTGTPQSRHSSLSIRASDLVSHWTLACSRDTMNKHTNWVNYKSLQLSLVQSDIIFNSAVEKWGNLILTVCLYSVAAFHTTSARVKMLKWTFQWEMEPECDKIKVLWWLQIRTWCHHSFSGLDNMTALNLKVLNWSQLTLCDCWICWIWPCKWTPETWCSSIFCRRSVPLWNACNYSVFICFLHQLIEAARSSDDHLTRELSLI